MFMPFGQTKYRSGRVCHSGKDKGDDRRRKSTFYRQGRELPCGGVSGYRNTHSGSCAGAGIVRRLNRVRIPVVMERRQGFYDTKEITLMVSMLRIIDNPHQDIPLATVLLSPAFSLTEEDLAQIRVESRDTDLYDALCSYEKADERYNKIRQFLEVMEHLRSKVTYAAVTELVQDIYDSTGIYEAVAMMKDGVQRTANMDKLMEQARQFERTSYHGLYQFVRYLEQITQQTEEAGEVNLVGEEENVVRIMTIHKSKGLEFGLFCCRYGTQTQSSA